MLLLLLRLLLQLLLRVLFGVENIFPRLEHDAVGQAFAALARRRRRRVGAAAAGFGGRRVRRALRAAVATRAATAAAAAVAARTRGRTVGGAQTLRVRQLRTGRRIGWRQGVRVSGLMMLLLLLLLVDLRLCMLERACVRMRMVRVRLLLQLLLLLLLLLSVRVCVRVCRHGHVCRDAGQRLMRIVVLLRVEFIGADAAAGRNGGHHTEGNRLDGHAASNTSRTVHGRVLRRRRLSLLLRSAAPERCECGRTRCRCAICRCCL